MRCRSIALFTLGALFASAAPAGALSLTPNDPGTANIVCHKLAQVHRYAESIPACKIAVSGYKSASGPRDWYGYYMQADSLEVMALDYSGLTHHQEALRTAVAAHRVALYVYNAFHLAGSDDGGSVTNLIALLVPIERAESADIRAGIGD